MCWVGKCDIKIAKRDFYVYKLGRVSDKGFKSLYQNFIYEPKEINKKIKLEPCKIYELMKEQYGTIYEGYHSYKDIAMPYSDLRPYYRTIYLGKFAEDIRLNNIYSIATFIIPKGSEYYENKAGEIVSSSIIYTGKYVKIGNSGE
jgi:hypothetical protein